MARVLYVIALLEILAGLYIFGVSKSAMHEISGVLALGFAFLTYASAAILETLIEHAARMDRKLR